MSIITETDIANRALQRVGNDAIADAALWTEISRGANEIRKCYSISRRSEMRRNVWRFSIRTQVLRPIDDDTRIVTFRPWSAIIQYADNDVVRQVSQLWTASGPPALGADPASRNFQVWDNYFGNTVAHLWTADATYMAGELVYYGGGPTVYMSLTNNNQNRTPPNVTFWFPFTDQPGLSRANSFIYPIGAGPSSNQQTRNVYMLPYGFLREADQSPKQGSQTPLGAPNSLQYNDWYYESNYFTTMTVGPIPYRFAANLEDPTKWDPMFVDGFSARLALDTCEVLTQSTAKIGAIGNAYIKFMAEARIVNAIEKGPVEAPEDSYITARR